MNTNFKVIGLTRLGIEPQVYRSRRRRSIPLGHLIGSAINLISRAMSRCYLAGLFNRNRKKMLFKEAVFKNKYICKLASKHKSDFGRYLLLFYCKNTIT